MQKHLFILTLTITLASCRNTAEHKPEQGYDEKRRAIEAVVAKYSAINPLGPADWGTLEELLKDNKALDHFDLAKYEKCLEQNIQLTIEEQKIWVAAGCKDVHDQYPAGDYYEVEAYRNAHQATLRLCDSLQKSFEPARATALVPCQEFAAELQKAFSNTPDNKQ